MAAAAKAGSARVEPRLAARVVARTPLLYAGGADAALDRPAHVRAGSALVSVAAAGAAGGSGRTFAVVQDDAGFVALVDADTGAVHDIPLPAEDGARQFDDARGNKKAKLDLEACVVDAGDLFAFGSGSSPARERVVLVARAASDAPQVTVVHARELYAAMRAAADFSGSELNVEGAALDEGDVVFFQRGNGAPGRGLLPVSATARVDRAGLLAYLRGAAPSPPPLRDVVAWDLGSPAGAVPFTFTDAVAAKGGRIAFLACAEDSPDATRDGPVTGVAIGRLDDRTGRAELALVSAESGEPLVDKAEGLAFDAKDPGRAFVVVDKDDPTIPSELLTLRLEEGWLA